MSSREPMAVLHRTWIERLPAEGGSLSQAARRADYVIEDRGYDTPCWIWQKTINAAGYGTGSFRGAGLDTNYAHRAYYMRAIGPVPKGWHVHHKCEVPPCVNPEHLEAKAHSPHLIDHKQADSHLTWEDVRAIRAAHSRGGASIDILGQQYGLGKSQIHNIVTNVKWHDPEYTPGRLAVCALEECAAEFIARRSHQRFCCPDHKNLWTGRRQWRRANGKPLDGPSRWKGAQDAA